MKLTTLVAVCVLLAFAASGCGVLSENIEAKRTTAGTTSATIMFDAVTSENYDTYELEEYGIIYSPNESDLSGVETGESKYTPEQNYPRGQVQTMLVQPMRSFGARALVPLTITLADLRPGTRYYFVPYVRGSYYKSGDVVTSAYGYADGVSNFTTVMTTPGRVSGLRSSRAAKRVNLNWSRAAGATGYEIYRSRSKSSGYVKIKTLSSTRYSDRGVKRGSRYYHKVRAYRIVSGEKYYGSFSRAVITVPK